MKVVMIGPFAFRPKGTVSARAFLIARSLVRRGHQVTILLPPYDNPAESGRSWEADGVRLENMVLPRDDLRRRLTVPLRMARRAVQLGAEVVHVFKPIAYSGLTALHLRRFSRRPLVLDTDDWEGTGGWNEVNPYPPLWKRFFAWQERWTARHADAVTVASRTLQTQVWGFGVEPERVVYLPNGPDPRLRGLYPVGAERIAQVRAALGVGDAPLALYLGHIPHGSDMDLAVDAFARVAAQLPQARLVIAGEGEGRAALQAYVREKGLGGWVLFPGWVERDQAPFYMAAADITINPYRDTLINRAKCAGKVVTAMAVGRAVISTRVGENLSYIEDGRSGLLTEPGDAAQLAQALQAALADREWAAELGRNAHRRIWERFDWEQRIGEVEGAYRIALARRGAQP